MCQIKTVKKKKMEEYKVSQNFLSPLSWSKFYSFRLWLFIISILNESKKEHSCSGCISPRRTSSLPPSFYLLLFLLLLLSTETFERIRLTAWGLSAYSSRFCCNSCKVGGDCGKIALMHSHCILLYVILKEKRELLIPWVKLTISMKRLWRGTNCTSRCRSVVMRPARYASASAAARARRTPPFIKHCIKDFLGV